MSYMYIRQIEYVKFEYKMQHLLIRLLFQRIMFSYTHLINRHIQSLFYLFILELYFNCTYY